MTWVEYGILSVGSLTSALFLAAKVADAEHEPLLEYLKRKEIWITTLICGALPIIFFFAVLSAYGYMNICSLLRRKARRLVHQWGGCMTYDSHAMVAGEKKDEPIDDKVNEFLRRARRDIKKMKTSDLKFLEGVSKEIYELSPALENAVLNELLERAILNERI